ncbi:MAG TPA: cyclopropane-fatty-acyl-phospholipid synthase family protein [Rhodocyclaceae bacterium]|nr:cyclopropane-fatty-acyl-phospholipid synthase family protein [Rhodocyclaceae bacterium]
MRTSDNTARAIHWVEQGLVPDGAIRLGIRRLLRQRLAELHSGDAESGARLAEDFFHGLAEAPLALLPEKANEQHYELPAEFFGAVLGPRRKYSCCWWPQGVDTLEQAEAASLAETCARAGLADGQRILELGCGWGSLSLWMAERFPGARITAVSNSHSQRHYIEATASVRGLQNLEVITQDFNDFDTTERYDRVVSVEMFEHLRNWPRAFAKVAGWLQPGGRFFMHVFAHREAPYTFEARDASDWMSRHFFSGGMMPSDDFALRCQNDLRLLHRWRWDGRHYARTSAAWLARMDAQRDTLMPLFSNIYGERDASQWWMRWRLFFLSVEELFAWDDGGQWWVSHYLFEKR